MKPGKPQERLSPAQFAAQFGVDRDTVYRWVQEGLIPESLVVAGGLRKYFILSEAVWLLRERFQKRLQDR